MFKPHYGTCKSGTCPEPSLIVVKAGWCQRCNENNKRAKRGVRAVNFSSEELLEHGSDSAEIDILERDHDEHKQIYASKKKARKPLVYRKKGTGELALFQEIWEEQLELSYPNPVVCTCCGDPVGWEFSVIFFSHLLAKGTYPLFRLERENIWIKCFICHQEWEFGDRSQPKFVAAVAKAAELKLRYYEQQRINKIV